SHEWPAEQLAVVRRHFPMPPGDGSLAAQCIRDRDIVEMHDYLLERRVPWVGDKQPRNTIAIPMLREGSPLGAIVLARGAHRPFADRHMALLQTCAHQAVMPMETVRVSNETKEALDKQTATSDILGGIASSPSTVQPVLESIVRSAARLCRARFIGLYQFDG